MARRSTSPLGSEAAISSEALRRAARLTAFFVYGIRRANRHGCGRGTDGGAHRALGRLPMYARKLSARIRVLRPVRTALISSVRSKPSILVRVMPV